MTVRWSQQDKRLDRPSHSSCTQTSRHLRHPNNNSKHLSYQWLSPFGRSRHWQQFTILLSQMALFLSTYFWASHMARIPFSFQVFSIFFTTATSSSHLMPSHFRSKDPNCEPRQYICFPLRVHSSGRQMDDELETENPWTHHVWHDVEYWTLSRRGPNMRDLASSY